MIDLRKPLNVGTKLKFDNETEFEIGDLIGKGANCLVYDGAYYDSVEAKHLVRIKELYPLYIPLERNCNGEIVGKTHLQEKYEKIKAKFVETYKRNIEIRNTLGITNSTSNVQDLLFANGTYYSICVFDEGEDYREYKDENLWELLKHVKALAEVVKKYHDNGYLHLDIKPENIFVIPETAEHVMLFDFDSVVCREALSNGSAQIMSYSTGFSAPEQIRGDVRRIGTWSDVFSIGAVLYAKIFGELPKRTMMQISSTISLDNSQYDQEMISPLLAKQLQHFFRKTLMISSYARWKKMDDVIEALNRLIVLADPTAMFVADNFSYNEKCFVGRQEELLAINNVLKDKQAVFLSGIGGIGKTELAKRYAYCYRECYDTIMFLHFDKSLVNTIMSDELDIRNYKCDEQEDFNIQYERKLEALKKIVTSKDLLIVDNFDVDYDDELEHLLECGCKFIFTSREDYRDYNYEQIDVGHLSNLDDAFELFLAYNDLKYSEDEKQAIEKIIKFVDYHTMMIVLLAKYLRESKERPTLLYEKFLEVEGTTNTGETKVKHRKDKRLSAQKVNLHLQSLFELSNFTDVELQIISSFSLLGQVKIQKQIWINMINRCFISEDIDRLIKRGWIEIDSIEKDCKISLHQIILDLVYNQEKMIENHCINSIEGYIMFLQGMADDPFDRRTKKKLADNMLERMRGRNILVAKYYYSYCKYIQWKPEILEIAESICMDNFDSDAKFLLAKIDALYIKNTNTDNCFLDLEDEQVKEQITKLYYKVFQRELKTFAHIRECAQIKFEFLDQNLLIEENCFRTPMRNSFWNLIDKGEVNAYLFSEKEFKLLLDVALALCAVANNICETNILLFEEAIALGISAFYLDAENVLTYLEHYVLDSNSECCSFEFKETLLKRMVEFYDETDYSRMAQCVCVGDVSKSAYYTECLENLRSTSAEDSNTISLFGTSYLEAADQVKFDGKYSEAIQLYEKAIQNQESVFDDIMFKMCDAFLCIGKLDKAEKGLLEILNYDEKNGFDKCYAYRELVNLYKRKNDSAKVKEVCEAIIEIKKQGDPVEEAEWILTALIEMIEMAQNDTIVYNKYMERYMHYLKIVAEKENIDSSLVESLECFWTQRMQHGYSEEITVIFYNIATRYRVHYHIDEAKRIYRCLINQLEVKKSNRDIYLQSLLWSAELFITTYEADYETAVQLLYEVECSDDEMDSGSRYYEAKLIKLKKELIRQGYDLPKDMCIDCSTKCDYYLVTKTEIQENAIVAEEQFQLWLDTTKEYIDMQDTSVLLNCLSELRRSLTNCVSVIHMQRYIESVLRIAELISGEKGMQIKDELLRDVEIQLDLQQYEWKEQKDVLLCFAMEAANTRYVASAVEVFMRCLHSDITGEVYNNCRCMFKNGIISGEYDITVMMSTDLETKKANEIVSRITYFLKLVYDCEEYHDLCCILEKIKTYYEQSIVEFKDEI